MAAGSVRNSREDVIAVALRLLDETGLPDLTMRRLAAALDVQPSALYWHFTDKQTLLAAVSDRIIDRVPSVRPRDDEGWAELALAEARALRDALLSYRDGAELVASALALGLGADAARERLRAALGRGDFDAYIVDAGADAMLQFLLGHVAHEQQRMQADSLGVVASPHAVRAEDASGTVPSQGAAFDFGFTLLLDGLAKHVRSAAGPAGLTASVR
ncbi:TetR family transcriptional regulator [uncultured Microbacterium sp.]|uniref:TetR family transcriptional regulator n=1 Tax=uncultured Microbacterium sp. TaxID=191216 RepID=UPI0035CA3C84